METAPSSNFPKKEKTRAKTSKVDLLRRLAKTAPDILDRYETANIQ